MRNKLFLSIALVLTITMSLSAQKNLSLGIIGTRFGNTNNDSKLTDIKNPTGYGIVASYNLNSEFGVAFTGEYYKGDIENSAGKERDIRGHLSLFYTFIPESRISPYFSAGIVFTNRNHEYTNGIADKTDNLFFAREGLGVDLKIVQNLSLNLDCGIYHDGLHLVGWSSSVGFRYGIKTF